MVLDRILYVLSFSTVKVITFLCLLYLGALLYVCWPWFTDKTKNLVRYLKKDLIVHLTILLFTLIWAGLINLVFSFNFDEFLFIKGLSVFAVATWLYGIRYLLSKLET